MATRLHLTGAQAHKVSMVWSLPIRADFPIINSIVVMHHNAVLAISTVLNSPKKDSVALKHSRAYLPPTLSPDLPRVRRKDFDTYLKSIGPEWERFQRRVSG